MERRKLLNGRRQERFTEMIFKCFLIQPIRAFLPNRPLFFRSFTIFSAYYAFFEVLINYLPKFCCLLRRCFPNKYAQCYSFFHHYLADKSFT